MSASLASVAAQQTAAATAGTAGTASAAAQTGQNALAALSSNFSDFLGMLMTQLQNQDPTSPLDTNQFTSELVQFSGVEQQINTNASLTQLIQLTQSGEVMQGSQLTGKHVTVTATQIPLQSGTGQVGFTAPTAEPARIVITDANGQTVRTASVNATAGQNSWTWDGTNNAGATMADGAYNISVLGGTAGTPLPFTVTGTATGVQSTASGMQLDLGAVTVGFGAVQSVGA